MRCASPAGASLAMLTGLENRNTLQTTGREITHLYKGSGSVEATLIRVGFKQHEAGPRSSSGLARIARDSESTRTRNGHRSPPTAAPGPRALGAVFLSQELELTVALTRRKGLIILPDV